MLISAAIRQHLFRVTGALVVLLAAVASCASEAGEEPKARAASGPHRNVIIVVTDDQTGATEEGLPWLSSAPGGRWVEFTNAFVENPACCPSRATILSGRYSHHTRVVTNPDGHKFDDSSTIATWLDDAGYETALFGKYLNGYPFGREAYVPPGWDRWGVFAGRAAYYDYRLFNGENNERYGTASEDYSTDVLAEKAIDFVGDAPEPFFLYLAPFAPHGPTTPAARHSGTFADRPLPPSANYDEPDVSDKPDWVRDLPRISADYEEVLTRIYRAQLATLLSVDEAVKGIWKALDERELLDRTVIVVLTDNGTVLGDHRVGGKFCPYDGCLRTALRIRAPVAVAHEEHRLATNVDLAPTVAELAGVVPPTPVDGRSLVPLLRDEDVAWREGLLLHGGGGEDLPIPIPPFWGIRTERWKYVELETGERELYDLADDPAELDNRANAPALAAEQARLADLLTTLRS